MSKRSSKPSKPAVKPAPVAAAPVVTEVASTATKLTKRNATPLTAKLVQTDKAPKNDGRAPHNKLAWQALVAALPATAAELAQLPALNTAPIIASQYISYMQRRGFLKVQS